MPDVLNGNVLMVAYDARCEGQQILLTHHYECETSGTAQPLQTFIAAVEDKFSSLGDLDNIVAACYAVNVISIRRILQIIYPIRYVKQVSASNDPTGTNGTEPCNATNLAAAVTMRSDFSGPHEYGTKHMGGMQPAFYSVGHLTPTALDAYSDLGTYLTLKIPLVVGGQNYELVPIILNKENPAGSATVTNYAVQPTVRTMHRRTVGLGS